MNDHLRPVGNPAPPRPRRPDSFTTSTTSTGCIFRAWDKASYPPRFVQPLNVRASASPKYCESTTVSLGCGLWGKPISDPTCGVRRDACGAAGQGRSLRPLLPHAARRTPHAVASPVLSHDLRYLL